MVLSRTEVKIRRLLAKCEFMVDENNEENVLKIEKCAKELEDMIMTLRKEHDKLESSDNSRLNNDFIASYVKRKDIIMGYLNAKEMASSENTMVPSESLPKSSISDSSVPDEVTGRYKVKARDQLFKKSDSTKVEAFSMKQRDLDAVISDENKFQEKIVDTMLDMVKNIKQRSVAASQIIKQDIKSTEKSSRLTDVNQSQMRVNNDTLGIFNKGAYKCWLWVLLAFVFIIFFYMIMFIKLFKKKS